MRIRTVCTRIAANQKEGHNDEGRDRAEEREACHHP